MSGYDIKCFLKDFTDRTLKNLEIINKPLENKRRLQKHPGTKSKVYEVTQLINSLLGLIIIPFESYKKQIRLIKDTEFKQLSPEDYEIVRQILDTSKDENRLFTDYPGDENYTGNLQVYKFIGHLRNAIAHGGCQGIHFYPVDESGEISGVIFYDNRENNTTNEYDEFCILLNIEEIRKIVIAIAKLYCEYEKNSNVHEKQQAHRQIVGAMKRLMECGYRDNRKNVVYDFTDNTQ